MSERMYEIMMQQNQKALLPETDYDKGVTNGRIFVACGGSRVIMTRANEGNESMEYWRGVVDGVKAECAYQEEKKAG